MTRDRKVPSHGLQKGDFVRRLWKGVVGRDLYQVTYLASESWVGVKWLRSDGIFFHDYEWGKIYVKTEPTDKELSLWLEAELGK